MNQKAQELNTSPYIVKKEEDGRWGLYRKVATFRTEIDAYAAKREIHKCDLENGVEYPV